MKTTIRRLHRQAALTLFCVCLALMPAGCDVKLPIYNTPHPDRGAIVLTTDWTAREDGATMPAEYTVDVEGTTFALKSNATELKSSTTVLPGVFMPGVTDLLAYNLPAGVTIGNGTATVDRDAATGLQRPDPGILFGGTATTDVTADDTVRVPMPMHQLFRRIQFELTISGGDAERITGIEAQLTGMAAAVILRTGGSVGEVTGSPVTVQIPFARKADKLTASIRVPGIIANVPQHTLVTLTFRDGKRLTAETDVSEAFANFNANKTVPLRLSGSLYAPVGSEVSGTIISWEDVQGGDVDAEM